MLLHSGIHRWQKSAHGGERQNERKKKVDASCFSVCVCVRVHKGDKTDKMLTVLINSLAILLFTYVGIQYYYHPYFTNKENKAEQG